MDNQHRRKRLLQLAPLLLLCLLASTELLSTVIQECVEFAGELEVGETLQLSTDEAVWIHANTAWWGSLYRAEVTGPDGAAMEVWEVDFDSGVSSCWFLYDQLHEDEIEAGEASFEWLGDGNVAIQLTPQQPGVNSDFTVHVEELVAPPDDGMQVIPVVAHGSGAKSSFFRTDLWIFNPGDSSRWTEAVLAPSDGSGEVRTNFTALPNRVTVFEDVVSSLFELEDTTGMLRINGSWSSSPLLISSRTYTSSGSGTFGQYIPASDWRQAAGRTRRVDVGLSRHLLHLAGPPDFRCNIGFAEVFGIDAELGIRFFDASGGNVGGGELVVPASSQLQINDVHDHFDLPTIGDLSAVVTVNNFGRILCYASVLDNLSSDPIYVPGVATNNAATDLVIPAAAATDGAFGTSWRTDMRALSVDGGASVMVSFIPTDGSEVLSRSFDFDGSGMLGIDDIVSELGGSGSGALLLEATHDMVATSRTYNTGPGGTFGQFVPASPAWWRHDLQTVTGIRRSQDYRSNVGMVWPNSSAYPFDVVVRLVDDYGHLLGSDRRRVDGPQHIQINDVFNALRVPWLDNCRVDFEVAERHTDPYIGVTAYASVIDNRTGDAVYEPASSIYDYSLSPRLTYELQLDNQQNCLLIDEMQQAVGIDQLPSGTLTATVSGEGDVGSPDQPIHVVCLYRGTDGSLRSAAVPVGGIIEDIAGGERLWCMIPDWKGNGPNHGAVTVQISGGDQPAELQLDARANAVHLDTYLETIVAEIPPAEAYRAELVGAFDPEHLAPHLLLMFDHKEHGSLRVETLVDDESSDGIDSTSQLLMVLLDWDSLDDNRGATNLEPTCTMRSMSCGDSLSGEISWTDCRTTPASDSWFGESITFEGSAGQIVSIVANWGGDSGRLLLADPNSDLVAVSSSGDEQYESRIDNHVLYDTGTYTIWPITMSGRYRAVDYVVELSCEDP